MNFLQLIYKMTIYKDTLHSLSFQKEPTHDIDVQLPILFNFHFSQTKKKMQLYCFSRFSLKKVATRLAHSPKSCAWTLLSASHCGNFARIEERA